jgi:hypothetical protein
LSVSDFGDFKSDVDIGLRIVVELAEVQDAILEAKTVQWLVERARRWRAPHQSDPGLSLELGRRR